MQGAYQFKFGPSTVSLTQKLQKITGERIAFHLYKRRDLESKIDKLAIGQLRLAKLIFQVATSARKEYEYNLNMRQQAEDEAAKKGSQGDPNTRLTTGVMKPSSFPMKKQV